MHKPPKVPEKLDMLLGSKSVYLIPEKIAEIVSRVYYRYGNQLPFEPFYDDLIAVLYHIVILLCSIICITMLYIHYRIN